MTAALAAGWLPPLAMALFVGGRLMCAAGAVPAARSTEAGRGARRRFGHGTLVALLLVGSLTIVHLGVASAQA